MRKQPGKKFGYIILPIAQVPGATAEESINSSAYKAVWQVINAISAHDDRFEAIINQFALTSEQWGCRIEIHGNGQPSEPGTGPSRRPYGRRKGDPRDPSNLGSTRMARRHTGQDRR